VRLGSPRLVVECRALLDSQDQVSVNEDGRQVVHPDQITPSWVNARADAAPLSSLFIWTDLDGDKVHAGRASMLCDAEAMIAFGWNRAQRQPWPVVNPRDAPASLLRKNVLELSSAHSSSDAQRTTA
jgi:hypothetical protein